MRSLALLLLPLASACAPSPPVLTSHDCPSQCGTASWCIVSSTNCTPTHQCLSSTASTTYTLDLRQLPDVAHIQNVTYPNNTVRIVIHGDAHTKVTLDSTVFTTPTSVIDFSFVDVRVSSSLLTPPVLASSNWQQLTLEHTGLVDVPSSLSVLPLDSLNLAFNDLRGFPLESPRLRVLNLTGNPVSSFPPSVFRMKTLTTLSLRDSNLTNVVVTPSQLQFFQQLETLEADFSVTTCPDETIATQLSPHANVCLRNASAIDVTVFSTSSSHKTVTIVVSVLGAVVGIVLLLMLYLCCCRQRSISKRSIEDEPEGFQTAAYIGQSSREPRGNVPARVPPRRPLIYTDDDVFMADENAGPVGAVWSDPLVLKSRIDTEELFWTRVLDKSAQSEVWLGLWKDRKVVGKRLLSSNRQMHLAESLLTKAYEVLATFDAIGIETHPNIIHVVGVSWAKMFNILVVMEYAERGDLQTLLKKEDPTTLLWAETKCQLAIDIAEALVFVQSQDKFLTPNACLLSSRNVILDTNGTAQLSLVQWDHSQTMEPVSKTLRYVAPEVLLGDRTTASALVYSFGVFLAELDTHQRPFDQVLNPNGAKASDAVILARIAKGDLQPTLNPECPEGIKDLVSDCLAFDPTTRPTAQRIVYTLKSILKDEL